MVDFLKYEPMEEQARNKSNITENQNSLVILKLMFIKHFENHVILWSCAHWTMA